MSTNPFEDDNAHYHVLINDEGQHSLWPVFLPAPAGWRVGLADAPRQDCLAYVEQNWTDMRPVSLIRAMQDQAGPGQAGQDQARQDQVTQDRALQEQA